MNSFMVIIWKIPKHTIFNGHSWTAHWHAALVISIMNDMLIFSLFSNCCSAIQWNALKYILQFCWPSNNGNNKSHSTSTKYPPVQYIHCAFWIINISKYSRIFREIHENGQILILNFSISYAVLDIIEVFVHCLKIFMNVKAEIVLVSQKKERER